MNPDFISFAKMNYHLGTNGTVRNQSNRVVAAANAYNDFGAWAYLNKKDVDGVTPETIADYFETWAREEAEKKAKEKAKDSKKMPSEIIKEYLDKCRGHWHISPTWSEIEFLVDGPNSCPRPSDINQLADFIYVWQNEQGYGSKKEIIKTYLSTYAARYSGKSVDKLFAEIGFRKDAVAECDKCLKEIHDLLKIQESYEIFSTIMKHWLWQVKRKIIGRDVVWEIWPNFYGASGVGKSTLIRKMCTPLSEFYIEPQISIFADATRERDKLTRYYILNFDELTIGGSSKFLGDTDAVPGDVQRAIKQFTTQKKMTSRTLGGQEQSTRRVTFNPISSANDHLYDIIFDEQTMRRFFEFHCTMEKEEADTGYYKKKDILQEKLTVVWNGVDENLEEGYWNIHCPVWEETRAIQDAYYPTKTTTTLWIEDERVVLAEPGHEMHTLDMYRDYNKWCRERGFMARSERSWMEDVKHIIKGAHTHLRNISITYQGDE